MNYRFPYKAHFQRNVVVYGGLIALLTGAFVFAVKSRSALKKWQKFNVFVSVSSLDAEPLREKIKSFIDEETIKQVVINNINPELTSYYTLYSTFGLEDADILILEKEAILNNDLKGNFLAFDESSSFYEESNYAYEGVHYGLAAYSKGAGILSDFLTYDEKGEYYLFVNKKSEHLLDFGFEGKTNSVLAFLKGVYGDEQ